MAGFSTSLRRTLYAQADGVEADKAKHKLNVAAPTRATTLTVPESEALQELLAALTRSSATEHAIRCAPCPTTCLGTRSPDLLADLKGALIKCLCTSNALASMLVGLI